MIATLDDLIDFTRRLANTLPDLRGSIVLDRPGCSSADIATLNQAVPGLPDSYLSVVRSLNVDGVAIGYFQLSPSSSGKGGLVQKLIDCNDPALAPMAVRYQNDGVYQVALWEADPIAVAHNTTMFKVGQVVKYNAGNPTARPSVLADGFEQFLLLAGTLDKIRDQYVDADNPAQAISDFNSYLIPIVTGRHDDMASTWKKIAEVVLN